MDFGLADRVVVITGAGSGIGLATARIFLQEGAQVIAGDLDPSAAEALSNRVTAVTVDMAAPHGAESLIAEAVHTPTVEWTRSSTTSASSLSARAS